MKKAFVIILTALLGLSMLAFLLPAFTAYTTQPTQATNEQQPGLITNVSARSTETVPLTTP